MELYSWKDDTSGVWLFSLLMGTNRNKSLVEIKNPAQVTTGVAELEKRLATLAKGETVFWTSSGFKRHSANP
jgi:hypothetical protein